MMQRRPKEREAAELLLIPLLLQRVAAGFPKAMRDTKEVRQTMADLLAAEKATQDGRTFAENMYAGMHARIIVDEAACAAKFTDRLGLVVFHIARLLTEANVIVIGDASPLRRALNVILPALEAVAQDEAQAEIARKQAVRSIRFAQRTGLFPDLVVTVE